MELNIDSQTLRRFIEESGRIVFFGGAGVSTESGIPDFRSVDGLYRQAYDYPPETILSHSFFVSHTEEFYRFYRDKLLVKAQPNNAHLALAGLERQDKLIAVVTQNIDGLHQQAGSRSVLELHGSIHRNYCMDCGQKFGLQAVEGCEGVPRCPCGGVVRPDVVLYEEALDERILEASIQAIRQADMLIIGGTSLVVYPAAGLVRYYRGNRLVLINKSPTSMDNACDLILRDNIGETLAFLLQG